LLRQAATGTGLVNQQCDKHRVQLYRIPSGKVICEECEGEKKEANMKARIATRLEEDKMAAVRNAYSALGLPARLARCSFASYMEANHSREHKEKCLQYVKQWPDVGGIVMLGSVGTGKTHLAVSICKSLCEQAVTCKISTVTKIIREIRSSWKKNGNNTEAEIIARYAGIGLLVIDEVGSQYGSDSERISITEIINDRYERMHPTILIGNVTLPELTELMGERVVDRVAQDGFTLVFDWESFRRS